MIRNPADRCEARSSEDRTLTVGKKRRLLDRSTVMKPPANAVRLDEPVRRADAKIEAHRGCLAKAPLAPGETVSTAAALAGEIVKPRYLGKNGEEPPLGLFWVEARPSSMIGWGISFAGDRAQR
jgi:hypothetical protein